MFMLVATSLVTEGTLFIPFDIRNGSLLYFRYACILLSHPDFFFNLKSATVESVASSHYSQQMCRNL